MSKLKGVVLLTRDDIYCQLAKQTVCDMFPTTHVVTDGRIPSLLEPGYALISFLSLNVVKQNKLDAFDIAINIHPGPEWRPGIGCYNFAIYNQDDIYGCVAHLMEAKVDTGKIFIAEHFPLYSDDSVMSLRHRTLIYALRRLANVCAELKADGGEGIKNRRDFTRWRGRPTTRKDLENLCELRRNMTEEEIERRTRACFYPGKPGAHFVD